MIGRVRAPPLLDPNREVELARERALDRLRDTHTVVVGDATEGIRAAEHVECEPVGRTEQACLEHVEPRDRECARQRHQEPGPVVGHDRDGDVTAVDPLAPNRRCVLEECLVHTHRLDVEREHVLLGQPGEECSGALRPSRSISTSRRSAATAFASPRSIAVAALTKRSRTSAAFDGLHAAGPVALESPMVSR